MDNSEIRSEVEALRQEKMNPLTKDKIYHAELFNNETNEVLLKEDVLSAVALTKNKMRELSNREDIIKATLFLNECFPIQKESEGYGTGQLKEEKK